MSSQIKAISELVFAANKKFWIALGIILWFYFVLSHIPAVWGGYLMTRTGELALSGTTGSVWNGSASLASVKIKGVDHSLGQLTWKLEPLSLLLFHPCASITTEMDHQQFQGRVCAGRAGNLAVYDATTTFPAAIVQPMVPIQIDGQFSARIDVLELQNNQIAKLKTKISWQDGKVFNGTNWMMLGGFAADVNDNQKMGIDASIFDVNSPVRLKATVNLLSPAGGSVKGDLVMPEPFYRESNAGAWLSMFATQQPNNQQGDMVYTIDMNL